ncbi:MAG: M1 family metallopeptidase [Flavobacteriales bacterium]
MDTHSASTPDEAYITHLDLDIRVDMAERTIAGTASYDIVNRGKGRIVFDTDGLTITEVKDADGKVLKHTLGDTTFLGRALMVDIGPEVKRLSIAYSAGADAAALQWLTPQQTGGKQHPFLFTQGEAILTRTWIPIQDSPGIRITYDAHVQVPPELMAVMSATNSTSRSADGSYAFSMKQPIPPYLIALAVGDIEFRNIGARTGVYAEPNLVDKAAREFVDMEKMVTAAEDLYGPYRWGRYDVIVLPPSFPFGGMENPMLTFATPTIIAGDGSLTALIAHELAHSWSGNLVTNATWNDFWLNEGFTVYFEKRICEKVYGRDYSQMLAVLGRQELEHTMADLKATGHPEDTELKLKLDGRNPDDGMTDVAYEKGYAFLTALEAATGREKFDVFLRGYFDAFAFKSMTTEKFLDYLAQHLLQPLKLTFDVNAWVYQPGLPSTAIAPVSDRLALVDTAIKRWSGGTPATELATKGWAAFEWMYFLRGLPTGITRARMAELDHAFGFTASGNAEIASAWYERCIVNGYDAAYPALSDFLINVGRRKFLTPLYTALTRSESGMLVARTIYKQARPNYHSISVRTIDKLLDWQKWADPVTM